jgi:aminoglycoside phosphotransferase (APT) family kinase protein
LESKSSKLSSDQIQAILTRCFGSGSSSLEVKELSGGTFNETYLVDVSATEKVVLKIAPSPAQSPYWDDVALMRREHNSSPFFSSIAPLVPKTIFADFTGQIVSRDYVLQTFMEGERWSDIEEELTEDENVALWRQCGSIVKRMHETTGAQFGYPFPGRSFKSWHEVILDRFSRISHDLKEYHATIPRFSAIADIVSRSSATFDEVRTPCLLHGDLWTFNLLIARDPGGPRIVSVLDTERAWWGDPLADWIMFLLSIRKEEAVWKPRVAAFQAGYGASPPTATMQFRQEVYKAMHIALSAVWSARHGNREDIGRANQDLDRITHL